jgi:hypothetical protein
MSEWDKLWKNKPFSVGGKYLAVIEWEKKVKAEGDKLQRENMLLKKRVERLFMTINDGGALEKLEAIRGLGLISLINDMREDLMDFYRRWQKNRDFEEYHKPVDTSDMRAIRKYMQDFEYINEKLKEVLDE